MRKLSKYILLYLNMTWILIVICTTSLTATVSALDIESVFYITQLIPNDKFVVYDKTNGSYSTSKVYQRTSTKYSYKISDNAYLINKTFKVMQDIINHLPSKIKIDLSKSIPGWILIIGDNLENALGQNGIVIVGSPYVERYSVDALAFIVAHEIAHSVLGHIHIPDFGIYDIISFKIESYKFTREEEKAADNWAITFMNISGYHVSGSVEYFKSLLANQTIFGNIIEEYYPWMDHDATKARLNNALDQIRGLGCFPELPKPIISFHEKEEYDCMWDNNIRTWTQKCIMYKMKIINYDDFPVDLFAKAPHLPPCGLNKEAGRTWLRIYDENNKYIYGFCGGSNPPESRPGFWYGIQKGFPPPREIYINYIDRQCGFEYISDKVQPKN